MIYKIGIIGHHRNIEKIQSVIDLYYPDIETTAIEFINISQVKTTVQYLNAQTDYFDAIIFTSKTPFDIINHAMHSKNPWTYIDHNYSQLHRTLLEASFNPSYNLLNVSIDSYDEQTVHNAYEEIGVRKEQLHLFLSQLDVFDVAFLEKLQQFHKRNYLEKQASFCITSISVVYEWLQKEGVPCILLDPTIDTIRQTVNNLILKMESQVNEESQIVVLSAEIDLPNEYALMNENEYQLMLEKTKVTQEIYRFAQRIQAAVIEVGSRNYLLFSTRNIVEYETGNLKELSLLKSINKHTSSTLSIGIGYGTTAREAKYNAQRGMQRSKKRGGNQAFVVIGNDYKGPLTHHIKSASKESVIDSEYQTISDETGLSINTIFKLHCIADLNQKDCFTSKELADEFGNSHRSMNRIIEKLEESGYLQIVGKKKITGAGRPSRIVKLLF